MDTYKKTIKSYSYKQQQWLIKDLQSTEVIPELEAQLEYWKQQLANSPPVLELPTDRPRPSVMSCVGKKLHIELPKSLSEALKAFSQREDCSLFMTLLAAFKTLLHRYSSQSDIVVGSPIAGRNRTETEDLISFFVNTLVLRTDLSDNPTVRELLSRIREVASGAYNNQDLPFEKLVEELQLEHSLSYNPLFQVMFVFQNTSVGKRTLADLTLSAQPVETKATPLDLTLELEETASGVKGCFDYNTDLFDETTIIRMAGHFQTLLEGMVAHPEQRVGQLPLLTTAERQQLLVEWNDTYIKYPQSECIHRLFEAQVEQTPNAIAAVFQDLETLPAGCSQITYHELNARANQLAHYLQTLGVGSEVLVGICVERSLDMLVGLLGILKAGGAYVPLDPAYPNERLALMLEDAQVQVLLTQNHLSYKLPESAAHVVCLDTDWGVISSESEANAFSEVAGDNLAYVIYTSGSTGKPKGVQLTHKSATNFLNSMKQEPGLTKSDILLAVTTISFDIAVLELYLPLIVGAKVVIVSREVATDGKRLLEQLVTSGATIMQATPATWRLLLASGWESSPRIKILCGGEALTPDLANQLLERSICLWNLYGPTETTVWSSAYKVEGLQQQSRAKEAPEPIGHPIANTQIYLLDSNLQPVPIGVKGELHIGGAGLARGYLNRPKLTNEKFIPNPFYNSKFKIQNSKLYKTGDLARYLPDGNIEYIGRIDHLVKLRGFRIELGEIETVLNQHPDVRQSVVIVREDQPGDKRLVAYIILEQESPTTSRMLRNFLKEQLPEYMVPGVFLMLEVFPLTPNGKVDRRALPAPETSLSDCEVDLVLPRTITEKLLASIWAEILGLKQVGIYNNFFELGGHSLLATQVTSRIRETFAVDVSLRYLFESPTIAAFSQVIETARNSNTMGHVSEIERVCTKENLPLSFSQARLWLLNQLDPEGSAYNLSTAYQLTGELNVVALEQSLGEIVQRHEALRTTFASVNGQPFQVIHDSQIVPLSLIEAQDLSEREVEILVTQLAAQPFNLATGPLYRVRLLRLTPEDYLLLFTIHHIIFDEWSENIFFEELATLYEAFCTGKRSPLPELPIQYADFANWQRQWLQGKTLEAQLDYWKQQLANSPPVLELPTDRPRPSVMSYVGKKLHIELPKSLSKALKDFSQKEGITLYMTLLAAFKTLLYRYSSQSDIVVGSPIAGRNRTETEDIIGFFVNCLVLRTDLSGNPTVRELLGRIREVALSAYEHQDLPFEKLVEELQPERSLSYNPLFQVMFVFQNTPVGKRTLPGLTLSPQPVETKATQFDLTLELEETASGLKGCLDYNTDFFDETTIIRMAGHFQTLLEGIVAHPEQRIAQLPLLTAAERQQLLVESNQTRVDHPQAQSVHQLFEEQVEKTPLSVALVFEDQQLTYRELNNRANQLAHHLQTLGVKPDVLVGLCAERSLLMIVGVLGILKAGGAYVPLDPGYPPERLAFILDDTQASVILTQEKLVNKLPNREAEVICLDSDWEAIANNSQENPVSAVTPNNLMYVIYTSGSTGQPKGVMIPHRGILNMLHWRQRTFGITQQDKVLQTIPFSFDPSVWQIFWPLSFGAQLVMARPGGHQDGAYLIKTIIEQDITVLGLVPSIIRMLLEEKGIEKCKHLKHVTTGGEALSIELMERFLTSLDLENVLLNCYGPTEVSIDATVWICPRHTDHPSAPIGRPIDNVQIYILDENLQPVSVGKTGELHIGGAGLARGYLNRPELTNQKFIPNPFSSEPGSRIYKTGDLARYLPDGNIEFLGRIDDQVKIRGFRIELGEIEAILRQHSAVQQTLVLVREDVPGNKQLVAYVVAKPEQAPNQSELRCFLQDRLPEYMVPTAFVFLDVLPLNANGKVDRRALPAPDISSFSRAKSFVAPSTPTEKVLASIWEHLLSIPQIGINDNFFALGGHSLLGMQVISRCRQAFSTEIPLQLLFEKPTIAGLAGVIDQSHIESADVKTHQRIIPQSKGDRIPLSFAQQRVWFLEQLTPDSATSYIMTNALRLTGNLNVDVLQQSLDAIVCHHEVLRTNFILLPDGSPIQIIGEPRSVELMTIDLTQEPESGQKEQVQTILDYEAQRPFDLASDLMLRATLLKIDQQEQILVLSMHHIASDGSSMLILWKQLASVYTAFLNGLQNPLSKLPIQYGDFAIWQHQWLSGEILDTQLNYWKTQLAGANQVLELPTDYPRPPVQTNRAGTQSLLIPKALSESITAISRQEGVTLFMTMLAAFGSLLYRYTGQEGVSIGTPIAGRNRVEIEELIGFFVNTVVLRIDFSGHPSFRSLLDRVRQLALDAYAHQEMPFEKLVEELQPERDTSRNPLFQVWFNMLNLEDVQLELPGLSCEPIPMQETAAKFDLTVYVTEQKQGIKLDLVYNADLFTPERMMELLEQYHNLLNQIVINPQVSITNLSLVTVQAKFLLPNPQQPLHTGSEQLVHTSFCEQAQRVPLKLAIVDKQLTWTYAQLEERANQFAHYLLANNIRSQEIVAIYAERSAALVWAILGVLKAGCAFMILDPAYPSARVIDCLEIAQPCAWFNIAEVESPASVSEYLGLSGVNCLEFSPDLILPTDAPKVVIEPDDLAYVAFTSGSTGKPKGIKGTHRPLSHFLQWHVQTFGLSESDRFSMLSGLAHDPLLRDIFTPLSLGATLCIPKQEDIETPGSLADWMKRQRLSVAHLTPAMAQLLTTNVKTNTTDLRYLFFSGDVLTHQDVSRIRNFAPQATCVNFYGATETPQAMGYFIVHDQCDRIFKETIPIGRGIADVQLLVLNADLNLAGVSELGEIYVRTPYLTQGYIGSDQLTQEKFIINPLTNIARDRLYKTGDLGRYLPDGNIEFVGRVDHQVKIRGFRIELGEIEAVLSQHPSVEQIVVISREDVLGEKQLVAYVVPKLRQVCTTNELCDFLKPKLPKYMIPASIVMLDALPLTPNNKVDRLALPIPADARQQSFNSSVTARNQLEEQLTEIWQEVLGIHPISVKDNFFDLGGHSLLAIRLFAEIEQKFGKKIPLTTLFQAGTIETLANRIALEKQFTSDYHHQDVSENLWSSLVEIQPKGSRLPLFCIHPLGGSLLGYYNLSVHLGLDQPVYGLQPLGLDGKQRPFTRVEDMAEYYI
ncbi:non-ribosomal peptide synthetase, partial [Aetokthonos hydrillicola]